MSVSVYPVGERALLLEFENLEATMRAHAALERTAPHGVSELMPAARTVLVRWNRTPPDLEHLVTLVERAAAELLMPREQQLVEIPTRYSGADLADVAAFLGISTTALIEQHISTDWRVAFTGFAPGFGYLVGDTGWSIPRRSTPRTRIPPGAVGLAGEFSGVYPRASPGGWQLIGETDVQLWDSRRTPPALLVPGTSVRFIVAERERATLAAVPAQPATAATTPNGSVLSVIDAGLQLLVQDVGREGLAHFGVGEAGAADRTAMRDANRAVGNADTAAILESVGGGIVLGVHAPGVLAVTGADAPIRVTSAFGVQRDVAHGVPFGVTADDVVEIDQVTHGLRIVVAARGGILASTELGSASRDTLAHLGPLPIATGQQIGVGDQHAAPFLVDPHASHRPLPTPGDTVRLRVVVGPRDAWFTADAVQRFLTQSWEVSGQTDRVGVRLRGEPLTRARDGELFSEGTVTGAIQIPPDGQPVLFGVDHPVTGGYPVIAVVIDADLDLAAQLPPGARVTFSAVASATGREA